MNMVGNPGNSEKPNKTLSATGTKAGSELSTLSTGSGLRLFFFFFCKNLFQLAFYACIQSMMASPVECVCFSFKLYQPAATTVSLFSLLTIFWEGIILAAPFSHPIDWMLLSGICPSSNELWLDMGSGVQNHMIWNIAQ